MAVPDFSAQLGPLLAPVIQPLILQAYTAGEADQVATDQATLAVAVSDFNAATTKLVAAIQALSPSSGSASAPAKS